MQIHHYHTVSTCHLDDVCHELGAYADARLVFPILPSPTIVRDDRYHLVRTGTLGGINHQQQLHQVIRRRIGGLNQVHRLAAYRVLKRGGIFAVGESFDLNMPQLAVKMFAHTLRDSLTLATRKHLERISLYEHIREFL